MSVEQVLVKLLGYPRNGKDSVPFGVAAHQIIYHYRENTMWQVYVRINDGYEHWEHECEGELFVTEAEADARVDELDKNMGWNTDYHFAKEVE